MTRVNKQKLPKRNPRRGSGQRGFRADTSNVVQSEGNFTVDAVAYGGKSVVRPQGTKVGFIDRGLPGDVIRGRIVKEHPRYYEIVTSTIVSRHPDRQISPCAYSDRCGGCHWLEATELDQSKWKKQFIRDALVRMARIDPGDFEFISPSSRSHYRRRIRIKARSVGGKLEMGFFARDSHELVGVSTCMIAHPLINTWLESIKTNHDKSVHGEFDVMVVKDPVTLEEGLVVTSLRNDVSPHDWRKLLNGHHVFWLGQASDTDTAPDFIWAEDDGLVYLTKPGQFQQAHAEQNSSLKSRLVVMVQKLGPASILDLYCGSGNLSLPLIKSGFAVTGVEWSKIAAATAVRNLEINDLGRAEFFSDDIARFLGKNSKKFDLVILDPPRNGLEDAIDPLVALLPKTIIYVSCDPMTMARDVRKLIDAGYKIETVVGYDFFPHTYHVETMILLQI